MGCPYRAKNFKNRNQIFKRKTHFQFVPYPTDHRVHIGKVLQGCTTAYTKAYKVALKLKVPERNKQKQTKTKNYDLTIKLLGHNSVEKF